MKRVGEKSGRSGDVFREVDCMRTLVMAILLVGLPAAVGCQPAPTPAIAPVAAQASIDATQDDPDPEAFFPRIDGTCRYAATAGLELTAAEKCWIGVLATHCSTGNDCIAACLATGSGRRVGGGCWHQCWHHPGFHPTERVDGKERVVPWQPPADAQACRRLGRVNGF